jgi:hypothetical protein
MSRIETPYSEIDIRVYLFFNKPEHLEAAIGQCFLSDVAKLRARECLTECRVESDISEGDKFYVLFTARKPGRVVPSAFREYASMIYENYPLEKEFIKCKNRFEGYEVQKALDDYGFDLPVWHWWEKQPEAV